MNTSLLPVIWNPRAGSARTRVEIEALTSDPRTVWLRPQSEAETRRALRQHKDSGTPRVAVCGGDGTLQLAVQEFQGSPTELSLLPAGSGNDLARAAGIPLQLEAALELALTGKARPTDLGACGERCFVTVAGVGIDGSVLEFLERRSSLWKGAWIYPLAVLLTLARFRPPRVRITTDSENFDGEAMLVVIANGSQFGGGMRIAPEASLEDGLFDVIVVRRTPKLRLLRLLQRVYSGAHVGLPEVQVIRSGNVSLQTLDPVRLNADGETLAYPTDQPHELRLLAGALKLVRP